jgi:hypothetical protein
MKRDVTKTGIRTKQGMVDDAISYAKRYIANNYIDPSRQIGIDYLLGERQSIFEQSGVSITTNQFTSMHNTEETKLFQDEEIIETEETMEEDICEEIGQQQSNSKLGKGRKKVKDRSAILASLLSIALLLLL